MLSSHPHLTSAQLTLRPPEAEDAEVLGRLLEPLAAETRLRPEKLEMGPLAAWLEADSGRAQRWVLETTDRGIVVGLAELTVTPEHRAGTLDLWIGEPFRRKGHGTAAGRCLLDLALRTLGLHRVAAYALVRQEGAERFFLSLGFLPEGVQRGAERREGKFEDVALFGVLASDLN